MDIESVKHPTTCNICGGPVIYCSNSRIYGREYGSGRCYYCTQCGAYVGTHKPRPREALGLLADARMRKGKQMCHEVFDPMWKNAKHRGKRRQQLYAWLAKVMCIPIEECHFGYFNIEQLLFAYWVLCNVSLATLHFDSSGNITNLVPIRKECEHAQSHRNHGPADPGSGTPANRQRSGSDQLHAGSGSGFQS